MALLLSCLSPLLRAQDCKATLCGTVTDGDTGQPFPYAEIYIVELNQLVLSDEQGQFHLHGICEGEVTVECSHLGCEHLAKKITVHGDATLDFELHHHEHKIEEITVVARRTGDDKASQSLGGAALASAQGQALGDALQTLTGVSALRTGAAIAKPVIRGLHSDRVLTVSNGVRIEGQQWGLDHGPEIDPYLAQRLGVVMGAYSLRYGADAIGGVVLVEPKPLEDIRGGWHGEGNLAAFSNGWGGAVSGLLERRWDVGNWKLGAAHPTSSDFLAARLQGTFRRSGNLRSPDYFLENTGLRESNGSAAIGWYRRADESHQVTRSVELFNSAFFTDIGIFRGAHIGNLTDLENAIERGRPSSEGRFSWKIARPAQRVAHHLFKAKAMSQLGRGGSKLSVQYARQYNHRQEFDAHKRFGSPPAGLEEPSIELEITTHSAEAIWEQAPKRNLTGGLGAQWTQQRNTTDRGALLPDYDNRNLGLFWMERWTQNHGYPLTVDAGLRYDRRRLHVGKRENTLIDQTLHFDNLSGTFGLTKQVPVHFKLGLMFGSAWRSPNVNELYSEGVHHGTASYERGDVGLRPERSFNSNLSLDFFSDHIHGDNVFSASLSAYLNVVRDFIYLAPQPQPVLTIRGAFPAFEYAQADARLTGLDWNAEFRPLENWALLSSLSLLRARNRHRDEPLSFMPADRFRHSLTRYLRKPEYGEPREDLPFVRLSVENVLRQSRVPENQDFAPAPKGYTLLNLEAGLTFSWHHPQTLRLLLAVENVANVRYRDYLNRLRYFGEEAGRDVSLRAKFVF